ncbi:hypothetical protein CTI14_19765 [Methylobacterium radiotolerans]|nr:hypothetical protein CTI14_19765 [Methylobacterium radiotolerans]
MIGYQFLHDQGLINMFPQNAQNNQQIYTQFESEMRGWIEAGGEVHVSVQVSGGQRLANGDLQWGSARPARIGLRFEVVNPKTGKTVYAQQSTMRNREGETYNGLEAEMARGGTGRAPNPAEVAAEMRRRLGL